MTTDPGQSTPHVVLGAEFEAALAAAEARLTQASVARRHLAVADAALSALLTIDLVLTGVSVAAAGFTIAALPAVAALVLAFLVARVAANRLRQRLRQSIFEDESYAAETASMLRELRPLLEQREQWSGLQSETVRRRLARFPIKASKR